MDLTPLYELRERLKAGAIAGTELVTDDFRLKRAVESFAALESASPVFGKIGQLARAVTSPECPDRTAVLLDAITLADAVLCTQGSVLVQGEVEPIHTEGYGSVVTNAPYSVLSALLDALTNSGGGRYSLIMDTHKQQPELFQDYRVKAGMVQALGASYTELADAVAEWLKEEGPSILPLLKNGFDPKGKKEMARRVQVIEAVAGAQANDFYLEQLETAEKDVRMALIYALRHTPGNTGLLLELVKTEKGNVKKMVYWALAQMEDEKVWDFWRTFAMKKPQEAAQYMIDAETPTACTLIAQALDVLLIPYEKNGKKEPLTKKTTEAIGELLQALRCKSGPEICNTYRRAAALKAALDRPIDGEKEDWNVQCPIQPPRKMVLFSQSIPVILRYSILMKPTQDLLELAEELYEQYGEEYIPAVLTKRLLTGKAQEVYDWVESLMVKKTLTGVKYNKEVMSLVRYGLSDLYWDTKTKSYRTYDNRLDHADMSWETITNPIADKLDERFFDLLMGCRTWEFDQILYQWIQPDNEALCQTLGKYFYDRAMGTKDNMRYLDYMKKCNYTICENLAVRFLKARGTMYIWSLYNYLDRLPGDGNAKAEEAQRVLDEIKKGNIKVQNFEEDRMNDYILDLRNKGASYL